MATVILYRGQGLMIRMSTHGMRNCSRRPGPSRNVLHCVDTSGRQRPSVLYSRHTARFIIVVAMSCLVDRRVLTYPCPFNDGWGLLSWRVSLVILVTLGSTGISSERLIVSLFFANLAISWPFSVALTLCRSGEFGGNHGRR
jgi:hypothetical protein